MIFVGGSFCRGVAFALLRHDMDQHRAGAVVAHIAQDRHQIVEIVTIDRTDMEEAKLLEQGATSDVATRMLNGTGDSAVNPLAKVGCHLLAEISYAGIGCAGCETRKITAHRA